MRDKRFDGHPDDWSEASWAEYKRLTGSRLWRHRFICFVRGWAHVV